ncbi:MAG: amylo-alpha-1,6-glucosidase [Gammaproteobacteria bacterium]
MNAKTGLSMPELVHFGREICGDLEQAERREWWLSNGLGAYASGTVAGSLTRRYHGLLVAPVHPPLGRFLVFAKADATLIDEDREWPLFTNRWGGGAVVPDGFRHIESFRLEGRMPVWRFAAGDAIVEQRIWMEPGAHTTCVAWSIEPSVPGDRRVRKLRVKLLVNARDHHGNARSWDFNPVIEFERNRLKISHPNWFQAYLHLATGTLKTEHGWYENFDLSQERARGLEAQDCHLCVGEACFDLSAGHWVGLVASLDDSASPYLLESMRRFTAHDQGVLRRAEIRQVELLEAPDWIRQLVLAADSFIFSRPLPEVPDGESVIAGFPWFGDWGRDTMIALPGLTLATGRFETARRVLETFARFIDQGMLPNVFPGSGQHPEYNTADAALWYIEAWRAYREATGDDIAVSQVFPVLASIIDCYRNGTRFRIRMDDGDGLLFAGEPGVQITWMDAKIGDWVVTPRIGKPVEINALWYNALHSMANFADLLGKDAADYAKLAEKARQGFARFVRPEGGLFDVLDGPEGHDASIRPNQILAVSLTHSPLAAPEQARVVDECARHLLGSYGLRSLSFTHTEYRPRYEGGVLERDGGYHQGPLWTWLLGHFALALHRIGTDPAQAQRVLEPIRDHLLDAGLGTVSEIFDGDPPHAPRGAPAQAWSVACVLEAWWRLERAKRMAATNRIDRQVSPEPIRRLG